MIVCSYQADKSKKIEFHILVATIAVKQHTYLNGETNLIVEQFEPLTHEILFLLRVRGSSIYRGVSSTDDASLVLVQKINFR